MDAQQQLSEELQRETAILRRIARGIVLEPALAEDVVQEAWLAALRAGRAGASGGGWLTEAVRRIGRGARRREARRSAREAEAVRDAHEPSAADTAARVELLQLLLDSLAALEEPYRSAVQMRLVDDLAPREIARRTGVPVETARTRVKRGVAELRAIVDARYRGRREELLASIAPLVGIVLWGAGTGVLGGSKTLGGLLMGAKLKLAAGLGVVALAGLWWAAPWRASPSSPGSEALAPSSSAEHGGALAPAEAGAAASARAVEEEAAPARERRVAKSADTSWVLRGLALRAGREPFPGAEVALRVVAGYSGPGETLHDELVRAGGEGRFELALPPPASAVRVIVTPRAEGFAGFASETLVLRDAPAPQELRANFHPLDLVLRGRVLQPDRRPARGAELRVHGRARACDAEGRFELRASSTLGDLHVQASAPGFADAIAVLVPKAGARLADLELVLGAATVLRGRVLDEREQPIAGARVSAHPGELGPFTTGLDGRFEIDRVPLEGRWLVLVARAEGFAATRVQLDGDQRRGGELELRLRPGLEIRGRVTDEQGRALPGSVVYAGATRWSDLTVLAVAGDEGEYVLRDVDPSETLLSAEREGSAAAQLALEPWVAGPRLVRRDFVLSSGLALRGSVVDEAGRPLEGVRLALRRARGDYTLLGVATDASGRFELRALPEETGLELELYGEGLVRNELPIDPATERELRVVMQRSAGLAGRVIDADTKAPVRSFEVRFVAPELRAGEERLSGYGAAWIDAGRSFRDEEGRWDTRGEEFAPDRLIGLEIRAEGYGPAVVPRALTSVDAAEHPITVELSPALALRGYVVDARDGRALAGVRVQRTTPRDDSGPWYRAGDPTLAQALTDASGAFVLEGLSAEPMSLYVEHGDYAPLLEGPFDPSTSAAPHRLELAPGAVPRGRLVDSKGETVAGAEVQISTSSAAGRHHRHWQQLTDADGAFRFAGLAAGRYQLSRVLRHERFATFDLALWIELEAGREAVHELAPRGQVRLLGELRSSAAASEATYVRAEPFGDLPGKARASRAAFVHEGRFVIDGLESGAWRLRATHLGRSGAEQATEKRIDVAPGTSGELHVVLEL